MIDRGVETFRYRGAVHYAPSGHIVLVNPREVHTGSAAHEAGWTYRTLYPSVEVLEKACARLDLKGTLHFPQLVVHDATLAETLRRFHRLSEKNVSLLSRSTALFDMLTALIQRHADVRTIDDRACPKYHNKVRETRDYLDAYAEHEVRLERLADLAELSPSYLLRTFKRETGLTPHAYQLQRRIERAKGLLAQGETPTQVALTVGFYDQSHLGKHFKRFVGVTPAQFSRGVGAISS